jgi:YHS domain-containing protein
MGNLIRDPVCGMQVASDHYTIDYLQMHYAFCSRQCQERFQENPHLYVGLPGQKSPKQEGREVIKQRRLHLALTLSSAQEDEVVQALRDMMGIKAVSAAGDKIEITYDLLQATAEQIEFRLEEVGVRLGEGWPERLRRAFVHYEEECEIDNLEVHEKSGVHRHHH